MSLDTTIAQIADKVDQALASNGQLATTFTQHANTLSQQWQARQSSMSVDFFVDQASGNDTRNGLTPATALRSIREALARTPVGGYANARLTGPFVIQGEDVTIHNRTLRLFSEGSTRHPVSFERIVRPELPGFRSTRGFRLAGDATLILDTLGLVFPALDGTWNTLIADAWSPIIGYHGGIFIGHHMVSMRFVNLDIPAAPFSNMIQDFWNLNLSVRDVALTGARTSILGAVEGGVTSTTGTAASTRPHLQTNLVNL